MSKIMVIDDDQKIREIIQRFLEQRGHQVILVTDGAFGMEAIQKDRPDLIVLDVMMPELDGCALGYHLKFQSKFAHIPILMLTSLADRPYLATDIAADFFMTKPFSGEKLVEKIEEILASGKVKVGIERPGGIVQKKSKQLYEKSILILTAILGLCSLALWSSIRNNDPLEISSTGARKISVMADSLFIYFIPVVVIIMIYALYLLKQMSKSFSSENKNNEKQKNNTSRR